MSKLDIFWEVWSTLMSIGLAVSITLGVIVLIKFLIKLIF